VTPLATKARAVALFLLWCFLGALILAAFFLAAFFGDYGPLHFSDPGTAVLFVPVLTAFTLGLLLVEYELVASVVASLVMTGIAIALIVLFVFSPLIANVASQGELLQLFAVQQVALSAIFLFPLVLLGTVVGRAVGDRILPPEDVRRRRDALMAETRAWHEQLASMDRNATRPGEEKRP